MVRQDMHFLFKSFIHVISIADIVSLYSIVSNVGYFLQAKDVGDFLKLELKGESDSFALDVRHTAVQVSES